MTPSSHFPSTPGLACGIALTLALGGAGIPAAAATYDMAIEDRPCEVVTAQMIATALDVPADSLEQSHYVASQCEYEMEGDNGDMVSVELALDSYETDDGAANYFREYTRSMSPEDISTAMQAVRGEAKNDDDSAQEKVTSGITTGLMQQGIQFEDVEGVADQARFEVSDGTLHMQQGNLLIKLRAYHGPDMPIPDEITSDSIMRAATDWQNDTMTERRQQALALAKLVLAGL